MLPLDTVVTVPCDSRFARAEGCVGAFVTRNWLEEWTSFGAERDYALAGVRGVPRSIRGTRRREAAAARAGIQP